MFQSIYSWVGATTGLVQGFSHMSKDEVATLSVSVLAHVRSALSDISHELDHRVKNASWKIYGLAGAMSGVAIGARYAFISLWWHLTEDEIKFKLLQGSPVKYRIVEELQGSSTNDEFQKYPHRNYDISITPSIHHGQHHLPTMEAHSRSGIEDVYNKKYEAQTDAGNGHESGHLRRDSVDDDASKTNPCSLSSRSLPGTPPRVLEDNASPRVLS